MVVTPVFIHLMPWFDTPVTNGGAWGLHWTMNNRDPNIVLDGKRQIASHYYPRIGPYASSDPVVIEWQMNLMRTAGFDGILIDWYGVAGNNGDLPQLIVSTNAIVSSISASGLKFAVVIEDRFWTAAHARTNLLYLNNTFFPHPAYARDAVSGKPWVLVFGPTTFQNSSEWDSLLNGVETMSFLTLWYQSGEAGTHAAGEYAWPYDSGSGDHLFRLQSFYSASSSFGIKAGVVYPSFHDFYSEGGYGSTLFTIDYNSGSTLQRTIDAVRAHVPSLDMIQVATWNDYGEE